MRNLLIGIILVISFGGSAFAQSCCTSASPVPTPTSMPSPTSTQVLNVDCTTGPMLVQLPLASTGKKLTITKTDATGNPCTIQTSGQDNIISGNVVGWAQLLTQNQAIIIQGVGSQWIVLSQ